MLQDTWGCMINQNKTKIVMIMASWLWCFQQLRAAWFTINATPHKTAIWERNLRQPSSLVMRSAHKPAVVNKRKGFKGFLRFYNKIKKLDGLTFENEKN